MNDHAIKILWRSVVLLLLFGLSFTTNSYAHEIRPAMLNIAENSPGWFDVTWKVPTRGNQVLALTPILPKSLALVASPASYTVPGAWIQRSTYKSNGQPLVGEKISIDGLSAVQTDVLLKINLLNGPSHSAILRPASPSFQIPLLATKSKVAWSYWRMGVFHILDGIDHLLFLLAILLIVSSFGKLLKTITAFTIAHSVTLSLASLGVVHIPSAPTEAVISLSIVFLATEIVRKRSGVSSLTERYPWIITFIFGLFHGLGFAGALSAIGLPAHEVPLALLMFNVGVETGQILFLTVVLGILAVLRSIHIQQAQRSWRLMPYAIGSVASFWTIERMVSLF